MSPRKKGKAKLKSVTVKIPWLVDAAWESDEREVEVLRDLVDQIRTRDAFKVGRSILLQEPRYFLRSVLEMRDTTRKLLQRLPVDATKSRLLLLSVMDWLAEIRDAWDRAQASVNPGVSDFQQLDTRERTEVMQQCWPVVESVRDRLYKLRTDLESQLKL